MADLEAVVKGLREQRGISQNALANAIHHDRSYLSKALRGVKPCGPALARLIDQALDADGVIIQAALLASQVPAPRAATDGEDSDDKVNRREFGIAALGMLAGGIIPAPAGVPASVAAYHVRSLKEAAAGLWTRDRQVGSVVLGEAVACYATARAMLDASRYSAATGRDLLAVTAELAACAGFIAFDAAEQATARRLLTESALLSSGTGQPLLTAQCYSLLALQSASLARTAGDDGTGLARESLRFLDQAFGVVRHEPSPRVHAMIAMRRARAHGLLGDRREVGAHIAGARRELDRGDHPSDPHWAMFVSPAEVTGHEGVAFLAMGQAAHAASLFRDLLADPAMPARNDAVWRATLAAALTAEGDHGQGAAEGLRVLTALEGPVKSVRTLNQLRPVRRRAPRGSEFATRFDAVAAAS
jgi:transcriptional regulator with XRE-family HTH domain